jgi:UDP-N-acetylglucosamine--N-acetylmuramyl-(pentapeptide) pyrophosphoryl-undecaprenol N-acetylglucosamine transferase
MPGITNRMMARWADEIHIPFPSAARFFSASSRGNIRITANPIRSEIMKSSSGREKLGLSKNKLTIAFVGGSQGASSINSAVVGALKHLAKFAPDVQMIHQTGKSDLLAVKEAYDRSPFEAIVQPYFHTIEDVYAATDLMVCRSGAMTLAEITACGLPAVLVPYPFATGDHQTFNAQALEKHGAAVMLKDDQLTGESLADVLISLIQDRKKLSKMAQRSHSLGRPGAAQKIARAALSLAHGSNHGDSETQRNFSYFPSVPLCL